MKDFVMRESEITVCRMFMLSLINMHLKLQ
jgi:hypothetical protein